MALSGTIEDPKIGELARLLGMPAYAALGLVEAFWDFARRFGITNRILPDQWNAFAEFLGEEHPGAQLQQYLTDAGLVDASGGCEWISEWRRMGADSGPCEDGNQ